MLFDFFKKENKDKCNLEKELYKKLCIKDNDFISWNQENKCKKLFTDYYKCVMDKNVDNLISLYNKNAKTSSSNKT